MPRESGASSTPRPLDPVTDVTGILDRPVKPGDDVEFVSARLTSLRPRLLRVFPGGLRKRHRALRGLHGLRACRGAITNTSRNALRNPGEPEQIVREIPVQVGNGAAGDVAIDLRGLFH